MAKTVTNSQQIKVSLEPWGEEGFRIAYLALKEGLNGTIPGGEVELIHSGEQKALDFITNQKDGEIEIIDEKDKGQKYKFKIFIKSRAYRNNQVVLKFVIIPGEDTELGQKFYTSPVSMTYDNITEAVEQVWVGNKVDGNTDTDVPDDVKIYRDTETGLGFLTRIGFSWHDKSVFAFSWDGLMFKDLEEEGKEPIKIIGDSGIWTQTNYSQIIYEKVYNYDTINPWQDQENSTTPDEDYSEKEPEYITSSVSHSDYRIFAKNYDILEKNYFRNTHFNGYAHISIVGLDMPKDWKLGDIVTYSRNDRSNAEGDKPQEMKCIVAENRFFFSQNGASKTGENGYPFEWTTVLWSLDKLPASEEPGENSGEGLNIEGNE